MKKKRFRFLLAILGMSVLATNSTWAGTETYTYDDAGRLTEAAFGDQSITYVYDKAGNLLSRTVGETTTGALDGIWKDAPSGAGDVSMNFYVQTYSTGSMLIVASPDGITAYAFLDTDLTDGFDADDLGGQGHHLSGSFSSTVQSYAFLSVSGGSPRGYTVYLWFPGSTAENYLGIFKDAPPPDNPTSMSMYVQTYSDALVVIQSPDARVFRVFLDGNKTDGMDADAMGGGGHLTCSFTSGTEGSGTLTMDSGQPQQLHLYRWFQSPCPPQ